MRQILFIISLIIGISLSPVSYAGIQKNDKYWIIAVCAGEEAGETWAKSAEISINPSPELITLLKARTCFKLSGRAPGSIGRVVRAFIDWEDDETYLVELSHMTTGKLTGYYTLIWPQFKIEEQSNGSSSGTSPVLQYDISSHLVPVQAGEMVWIGGMCRAEGATVLFLSAQTGDVRPILQELTKAGSCRSLGSMQRVLIAAVITDGIDREGDTYWLVQLANSKAEPQPWYSLAWECTLEANLQLSGGDCR